MKTPNLLTVPKDSPSKRDKIKAFKAANKIETFFSSGLSREDLPWVAGLMPEIWKLGYGVKDGMGLCECYAHVARLIEEAGFASYGTSEIVAIRAVCDLNKIPCPL